MVALRKESVDRNHYLKEKRLLHTVALRKESVDRNLGAAVCLCAGRASLSARRAWIEIAHRAEYCNAAESLSARRAWIEIAPVVANNEYEPVALRKESVDRNSFWWSIM